MAGDQSSTARTLEYTPTWALATVACVFVIISLAVERSLHSLGHVNLDRLFHDPVPPRPLSLQDVVVGNSTQSRKYQIFSIHFTVR